MDKRSDIWAFGCVFYEMLTRRPAFTGETFADILGAIVKTDPDWDALPDATPTAIRRLLKRCLAKDPNERLHAIEDARLEMVEARSESTAVVPHFRASLKRERALGTVAGVAIVAAFAMVVPTVRYFRPTTAALAHAPELRLQVNTPPTTDPVSMALSPDSRRLTFVATSDGTSHLWLRPLDVVTATAAAGH